MTISFKAKKILFASLFFGFVLVLVDQVTKYYAFTGSSGNFLRSLEPFFSKYLFANSDFAFSLKLPHPLMWLIYVILLSILIIWFWKVKEKSHLVCLAFVLILAGALSNIFDRIMLGYVRDFIYVFWGNTFNLADVYIMAGIVLMLSVRV